LHLTIPKSQPAVESRNLSLDVCPKLRHRRLAVVKGGNAEVPEHHWVNSLWLLITLLPAVALMSFVVIPREEQYLETRFPSDYLPYKASVRRWL
jgi:protein-S-isoprenylcysteine O-methyltransferase Ste14